MGWRTWLGAVAGVLLLSAPAHAADPPPLNVPVWTAVPFIGLLLSIALLPLFAEHFWHSNRSRALVAFVFAAPVAAYLYTLGPQGIEALLHGLQEYASFIVLLLSLYTVAGGIVVRGSFRATPLVNALFLASGAVLANFIGTTGASMVLIRPVLRINRARQNVSHVPIFFIFLVSNLGGLLTPLGDPPLFLGFLRGIDFFWTLQLWPQWLVANGIVLAIFFLWDSAAYVRERDSGTYRGPGGHAPFGLAGLVNVLFLAGILAAVLMQSRDVADSVRAFLNQFFACPDLQLTFPGGELVMLGMAALSLLFTPRGLRPENEFTWGAIVEVAILFAGIFVTMVPALDLLKTHREHFALDEPWQYFWLTGALSSFLDNAPTYLTFATIAAAPGPISDLPVQFPRLLEAISCGAVFMGANTYIGNGPNFMVKAIAESSGFRTPGFLGYMLYSGLILLPVFVLITFLFFPPA